MIIAVRSEVARTYKVTPAVAKNGLLQLAVGLCFGIGAAMLGEHWVALVLFISAPAIAKFTILRGQLAQLSTVDEFYKHQANLSKLKLPTAHRLPWLHCR